MLCESISILECNIMEENRNNMNRRIFLKKAGAAGIGTVLVSGSGPAGPKDPNTSDPNAGGKDTKLQQVPKRKLGKTGLEISCLGLGGDFSFLDKQIVLRRGFEQGVNYWDTAYAYANGNGERGIGQFISKNPELRKQVVISSKASDAKNIEDVEQHLQESLKRLNTDYIDVYYGVHILINPSQLTDDLREMGRGRKETQADKVFWIQHTSKYG